MEKTSFARKEMHKDAVAIITDMNQPLGKMVGNATEVVECIKTLKKVQMTG